MDTDPVSSHSHGSQDSPMFVEEALKFWDEIVRDPAQRTVFRFVGDEYASLLESAMDDGLHLAGYHHVCYLVDFDVVREYLEIESIDKVDTLALYALFNEKDGPKYALPMGAYLELLDWFRKLKSLPGAENDDAEATDREGFIFRVVQALGIHHDRDIEADETIEQIMESLDRTAVVLDRLYKVLTDPRFVGVVCDHEPSDVGELRRLIKQMDRYEFDSTGNRPKRRRAPRTRIDLRDAMNLAIAVKSARALHLAEQEEREYHGEGFILISNTSLLLKLPDNLAQDDTNDFGGMRAMWRLFGVREKFHVGPQGRPSLPGSYPVMTPRNALILQDLGVFDNRLFAISKAKEWRDSFKRIADGVRMATALKEFNSSTLPPVKMEHLKIAHTLNKISIDVFSTKSQLRRLETHRTNHVWRDYARRSQLGAAASPFEELRQRSTDFRRLLAEFRLGIDRIPGIEYRVAIDPHPKVRGLQTMAVTKFPSLEDEDPLIDGEIYSSQPASDRGSERFYVMRWPIECAESRFTNAVAKIDQRYRSGRVRDPTLIRDLEIVTEQSFLWMEGVVVYTSTGLFGFPLEVLSVVPPALNLNSVSEQIELVQQRLVKEISGASELTPGILQLRINTLDGDFVFDLVPTEDGTRRYCTVISTRNLRTAIAALFEETAEVAVIEEKFTSALDQILSEFGQPA